MISLCTSWLRRDIFVLINRFVYIIGILFILNILFMNFDNGFITYAQKILIFSATYGIIYSRGKDGANRAKP